MQPDCYIKIGEEQHYGLEAATLLAGIRGKQPIEICFQGCSEADKKLLLALHEKWRQDTNHWQKYRLALFGGLGLLLLGLAYASGLWDQAVQGWSQFTQAAPDTPDAPFFANQASLYTFVITVGLILGVIGLFLRRLASKAAKEAAGDRLRDNEASRRLARDYDLRLGDERLLMSPRQGL